MKCLKICLFMGFVFTLSLKVISTEEKENKDPELTGVLETMMDKLNYIQYRNFPDLPTETDVERLEGVLFTSAYKLPIPLKEYHLTCGNRRFGGGVRFPTLHQREIDGRYSCNLLDFIRDGHEKGVPSKATETSQECWIPFAEDGSAYVCMELLTGKICYFSFVPRLKKDKLEYGNFSSWIEERLITNNKSFWK